MKNIYILILCSLVGMFIACDNTEPTRETRLAEYAEPTIFIEGQEDLFENGVSAMVENDVTFKMKVVAEAGLTDLLINDTHVKKFTYGQLIDEFDYKFTMPDVEDTTLVFTVCDELKVKTSLLPIKITAAGRMPDNFLVADMQGEFLEQQNVELPMHSAASKIQDKISLRSDIEGADFAYLRRYWEATTPNAFSFAQPDPAGGEEKCFKITKEAKALNMQIRLDKTIPSTLINDIMTGSRVLVMDIYIENNAIPSTNNFTVCYAKFDKYKNDASGMVHNSSSTWTFAEDNLNRWNQAIFNIGTGNTGNSGYITTSEVDMLVIKPTMNDIHGPYYIKNIRIVKSDKVN